VKPARKLALFAVALVASFGVGAALGAALPDVGPDEPAPSETHQDMSP
jgi:hypothetical protein